MFGRDHKNKGDHMMWLPEDLHDSGLFFCRKRPAPNTENEGGHETHYNNQITTLKSKWCCHVQKKYETQNEMQSHW